MQHLLFQGPSGTGKCVTGDSIININNTLMTFNEYEKNFLNMEDVILSDNYEGKKGFFVILKSEKTIKLNLDNGNYIEGTPEHKIKVFDENFGIIWKSLYDIKENDTLLQSIGSRKFNTEYVILINNHKKKPHSTNEKDIFKSFILDEKLSYFIGVYLGNGNIDHNSIEISSNNKKLLSRLQDIISNNFNLDSKIKYKDAKRKTGGIFINSVQLVSLFKDMNLDKTARFKNIPLIIRKSPESVQRQCIKGLIDTDSYSDCNYIEYYTASKDMCYMMFNMLLNVGCYCKIKESYNKQYNHTYYTIVIPSEFLKINKWLLLDSYKYDINKFFNKELNSNINFTNENLSKYIKNILEKNLFNKGGFYKIKNKLLRVDKIYSKLKEYKRMSFTNFKKIYTESNLDILINDTIKYINKNSTFFVRVKSKIEINKVKDVYDFHIPSNHIFICNGLINHNTTTAKILAKKLNAELLEVNASRDNGVDIVREKIEPFCKKMSSKPKIVFLDEADNLSLAAQKALRRVIEDYQKHTKFILACNYPRKIIEPVRGRLAKFEFHSYKEEEIKNYIRNIAEKEEISISEEVLSLIIKKYRSDIRSMVHLLNRYLDIKEIKASDLKNDDLVNKIFLGCKKGDWVAFRMEMLNYNIDYERIFCELDETIFSMNTSIEFKRKFNSLAVEYDEKLSRSFNKEMCFAAFLSEFMELLNK